MPDLGIGTRLSGRTVLLITHRFTTAMQADIIHVVMADGQVVESSTHQELMRIHGHYTESWRQQVRQQV